MVLPWWASLRIQKTSLFAQTLDMHQDPTTTCGLGWRDSRLQLGIGTNKDYCVILDNSNYNLPGRWYDVPCTESHFYICSMPLDPDSDTNYPQPGVQCLTDFVPYGTSCFGVFGGGVTDSMTFDDEEKDGKYVSAGVEFSRSVGLFTLDCLAPGNSLGVAFFF